MTNKKGIALVAILLALTLSSMLMAQRPPRNANTNQPAATVDYGPRPQTPEELAAFNALNQEPNPATKVTLADQFLTTYPNSQLAGFVQRFRMEAFTRQGKFKEAVAAGEQALTMETKYLESMIAKADADAAAAKNKDNKKQDKNAPPPVDKNSPAFQALVENTEKAMMYYYQNLMSNYQQLNDASKTMEWGTKALGQNPDDLLTLITLSSVMAARPPEDPKAAEKQNKDAEEHAKKANSVLTAMLNGPAGAQIPPDAKASLSATIHQTLGRVHYNNKKYPEAQREYIMAINSKKDDADSYYYLGLAQAQDKPPKVDDAMESFAKAIFLKGPTEASATDILKQLYQNKNKSLDGMDAFIKAAGAKLNQ